MYHSYVMGIEISIMEFKKDGFIIESDRNNYMVSIPEDKAEAWEKYISMHLGLDFWNEYITDDCVIFLFHLQDGIKRYEVHNYENNEVLALCEKLCDRKFGSIKDMLVGNRFYKDKIL